MCARVRAGSKGPERHCRQPAGLALHSLKEDNSLKNYANPSFADRNKNAAEAKKKLLEKFKAKPALDDPQHAAKRAERVAAAKAREERRIERERVKAETEARKLAEQAEAEAAALVAEKAAADALVAEAAAKKAERDQRYAARKARKR
nr:DUF6481 family protein [uncultured Maricaulis sp.]